MKQIDKITTKYKGGSLPEEFFESLKNADEEDLRVMLAAILLEEKDGVAEALTICEGLGISNDELSASVKYWKGAGLLGTPRKSSPKTSAAEATKSEKNKFESAHKDGKVEQTKIPTYTTEELTVLMKKRKITSDFIADASRIYGKIFNQHEVEIIARMIDYIGYDKECVLMLLSHYAKEKKTLRYIEKVALALYDEGIFDAPSLQNKLCAMENARALEGQIRSMFGMNGRALTTKEKKFITSWTEKMGFDIEMIRLAYDITVDVTHEAAPAYANGILERWYADGIDTPEKVKAAAEKKNEERGQDISKSFDNDDFFEAALRRSYGEG